jgi:hypothetical protein
MADFPTGSAAIASFYATDIVSREVGESLTATVVIAPYVWMERAEGTKAVKFGLLPTLTASGFTDTVGMAIAEFDPTSTTVTAAPVGITVRVTGMASSLRPNILAEVGSVEGQTLGAKIDTDIAALFSSVTASVGTSGAGLTVANHLAAIGKLNAAKVPQSDRVAIYSAVQYQDLLNDTQAKNAFAFQEAAKSGQILNLFGVPCLMSPVLATANSGTDNVGAMFNRRAFGLGLLKEIGVDVQRAPAQFNATDIAATVYYGVALIDTLRAVKVVTKAT